MNETRKVTALYFSPTGGTRAYVTEIARAMGDQAEEWDLTRPEVRRQSRRFGPDEVVVLGVPVAAGEFIAPHTFSAKVGAGRPDEADRETARKLGRAARSMAYDATADKLEHALAQPRQPQLYL